MQEGNKNSAKYLESIGGYALIGWLIGTVVPLAVVGLILLKSLKPDDAPQASGEYDLTGIFVIILFLCSLTGVTGGAAIGGLMIFVRRIHFSAAIIAAPVFGFIWGVVTGFVGGFSMFVVGGIVGAIVAAPIGAVGFLVFAAVYETLARRNAGVLGWRKTLATAISALFLTMTVGAIVILVFDK